jgi:hypothetical protein
MGSYITHPRAHEDRDSSSRTPISCPWQPSTALVVWALLFLTVFFAAVRFRLRNMPLERDEGEYAYSGQLLLQHIPPYKLAYNMKLPGIYATYAIILLALGQTASGIHLGLLFVNAFSSIVLYLLTARPFGKLAGLVAAASFFLLSASPSVMGFQAHATNFVVLPALIGILFLIRGLKSGAQSGVERGAQSGLQKRSRWMYFVSGLLCGIAFLMKQHGLFFAIFCFFYLIRSGWKRKQTFRDIFADVGAMAIGFLLPYAVTCWVLYRLGVFQQFWFWTVSYAGEYSKMGLHRGVHAFVESFGTILRANLTIWLIALIGFAAPLWSQQARKYFGFTAGLLLLSFLALCPGAYFRPHYFVLLLPVAAMLSGIAISSTTEWLSAFGKHRILKFIPVLVLLAAFGLSIVRQHTFYFSLDPAGAMQATYRNNPFIAAVKTADYIRQNSADNAQIAVLGSEPEIYFYAHRRSATGYLYMYSLLMRQKYTARMQQELIHEVERDRPEYVVYVDVAESWGDRDRAPQAAAFLAWVKEYSAKYYELDGVAEVADSPAYVWGNAARNYNSRSPQALYLFKRKDGAGATAAGSAIEPGILNAEKATPKAAFPADMPNKTDQKSNQPM